MSENSGSIRKVFPGGNTPQGFYSLFNYIIGDNATHVFVLKGGPGVGKSTFMKTIEEEMIFRGFDVEEHHCSSDPESLDALVIPSIGIALLDGTAPHVYDPRNPAIVDEIIHLGDYWDEKKIMQHKDDIMKVRRRGSRMFKIAYSLLKESKTAYDEWKSYVSESVDRAKYNRIKKILLESVLEGVTGNYKTAPESRHLFGSSITPKGLWNYIDTLITSGMKVYAVKGEPGTGVKELIERAAAGAEELGLYTEQYHCPFEPDKIDMVIIPAAGTAVVNTTQPLHFDVHRLENVEIVEEIDLDLLKNPDVLEQYRDEIEDARTRFSSLLDKAIDHLAQAKSAHLEIEKYYIDAMNFEGINRKREEILERILKYAE